MRQRLRSLPRGVWVLGALASLGAVTLVLAAAGSSLPGPPVKRWLGLDDSGPLYPPCRPSAEGVRVPSGPTGTTAGEPWRRESPVSQARHELAAAAVGGRIYLVGGNVPGRETGSVVGLRTVEVYDPQTGSSESAPLTQDALDHADVVEHEGELYLFGGYIGGRATDRTWRYSPSTRRWTELAPLSTARGGHAAAAIAGRLYVVGGAEEHLEDRDVEPLATLEVYDVRSGRWSSGPPMPTARHHVSAVAAGGQLYVAGGREPGDFSLGAFERYDPASGTWERLPPLPQAVGSAGMVAGGGHIVVVGGSDELEGWVTPATWAYEIRSARWRRLPDLEVARHGLQAMVVDGRIYGVAGAPCSGFGLSDAVESLPIPR